MSAISETLVREYFEALGFYVRQPVKYQVMARTKTAEEEVDLLVVHPDRAGNTLPGESLWGAAELRKISQAVVGIRGWHTERFTPALIEHVPEICRFAQPDTVDRLPRLRGEAPMARILCLPDLPASRTLRKQAIALLHEKGIDGIIPFRTVLSELVARIDVQKTYEKSDVLQVLRILKRYDLLRDAQLELFVKRARRRSPAS